MKKLPFIISILTASISLTSFVISKQNTNETKMESDWQRWGTVTGIYKYDVTESNTLTIWYKENGNVRKYGYTTPLDSGYPTWSQVVSFNSKYQCNCDDPTRRYRYEAGNYVFNANLPKFSK